MAYLDRRLVLYFFTLASPLVALSSVVLDVASYGDVCTADS